MNTKERFDKIAELLQLEENYRSTQDPHFLSMHHSLLHELEQEPLLSVLDLLEYHSLGMSRETRDYETEYTEKLGEMYLLMKNEYEDYRKRFIGRVRRLLHRRFR